MCLGNYANNEGAPASAFRGFISDCAYLGASTMPFLRWSTLGAASIKFAVRQTNAHFLVQNFLNYAANCWASSSRFRLCARDHFRLAPNSTVSFAQITHAQNGERRFEYATPSQNPNFIPNLMPFELFPP